MAVPNGYRKYQRIRWTEMMEKCNRSGYFVEGVPTPSNVEAHIISARDEEFRRFRPEEDVTFRTRCAHFRNYMMPEYIRKEKKIFRMDSDNCKAVGEPFYHRDRTEVVITVNHNGYKNYVYLNILNERTKKVIDKYNLDKSKYSRSEIAIPFWRRSIKYAVTTGTKNVYKLHDGVLSDLPAGAQKIMSIDNSRIENKIDRYNDSFKDDRIG